VLRFTAARTLQMLVSVWVAVTLIFIAVTQLPGDPVRALFGFRPPPPELYNRIAHRFGLDRPLWEQYWLYLSNTLTGDLGNSFPLNGYGTAATGPAVTDIITAAAPVSAVLVLGSLVLQVVVGVGVGALGALRRRRVLSAGIYALAVLLVATPVLVAAYVLRTTLSVELRWFPLNGVHDGPISYVLPVVALSALSIGYIILLTRSEVRETLAAPFLKAARGRGYTTARLLTVHAMRPSLIPVVAFIAANIGQLFVGLIIVEGVFGLPGVGGAVFEAIRSRDRSLLIGLVTVFILVTLVLNTVADLVIALIDPRVRSATVPQG
jgi:ABC-type dipeptide/oligopeptide/nickel transport system permease component